MEDRFRKVSCITSAEIAPPILLRRRLSAPETIMRKHTLAQQRSSSQDSENSQNSDTTQSCPVEGGSDPNLARKRDQDIRKSTLMKRFWENSKNLPFPRTYSEWQYSFGKMKLSSNNTTPEHVRGSRKSLFDTSPKHRRLSPKHDSTQLSPKRKVSMCNGIYSPTKETVKHHEEDYMIYSSNFSNVTSTDSAENTSRALDHTTPTIHSDSAYTNSFSAQPSPENNNQENIQTYQINSNSIQRVENSNIPDLPIKYQFVIHNQSEEAKQIKSSNESATQTSDTTNLNVISNVQLSQSTLNLIFNQVMQDVLTNKIGVSEDVQPKLIKVQNLPSFSISKSESPPKTKKPLMSELNVGTSYKSKDDPLVPRLSGLPRSASMEVNISSNESFDKESDSASLVDSLEEFVSPKDGKHTHDDKLVRGELALLPDNSDHPKQHPSKKAAVFYIPIKLEDEKLLAEDPASPDVSAHLPSKLKEKLMKRQLIREEKRKENRMRFDRMDLENGNIHPYFESMEVKPKSKKKKTTLPQIENKKEKVEVKSSRIPDQNKNKSFWLPKTKQYKSEKMSPFSSTGSTKKIQPQKPEAKEIEILEIMEIIEPERLLQMPSKNKSRIPVLVQHQKLPKIPKEYKPPKPSFLDFELSESDPKLDQLIANILIDSLNREDYESDARNFNRMKYTGKFDSIPEERPMLSEGNAANNNPNLIEKAAEFLTKQVLDNNNLDENVKEKVENTKIPKGWITFYMLQKNNSPDDSTSDEGPNSMATKKPNTHGNRFYGKTKKFKGKELCKDSDYKSEEDYYESDSESEPAKFKQQQQQKPLQHQQQQQQQQQQHSVQHDKYDKNGWSVTVSGTTNGKPGPDLEMRLKFPHLENAQRNRSDVGIQKGYSSSFPALSTRKGRQKTEYGFFEDKFGNRRTSEINKSKQYLKNCERTTQNASVGPAKLEPRPTKTSRQRCMLNRPVHRHYHQIMAPLDTSNRNIQDILGNLPEILAVSGNAMNRQSKQLLPKMSERDLKRFLAHFNNTKIP